MRILDPGEDLGSPVVLAVVLEPQEGDVQVGWSGDQNNLFLRISLAPGLRGHISEKTFILKVYQTCTCRTGIGSLHQVFLALSSLSRARAQ